MSLQDIAIRFIIVDQKAEMSNRIIPAYHVICFSSCSQLHVIYHGSEPDLLACVKQVIFLMRNEGYYQQCQP